LRKYIIEPNRPHAIPNANDFRSKNARSPIEVMIPMIGVSGYSGVLNGRCRLGLIRLSLINDKFTKEKPIKNPKLVE